MRQNLQIGQNSNYQTFEDRIIILSIGQLINSDMKKTIHSFSSTASSNSLLGYWWNFAKLGCKYFINKNIIESHKKGEISNDRFIEILRENLKINPDTDPERIAADWNSMCQISEENMVKIVDFVRKSQQHQYSIFILCCVDPLQYKEILRQLDNRFGFENMPNFEENNHIFLVKSFQTALAAKESLARRIIEDNSADRENVKIISLHSHVNPENVTLSNAELIYKPETQPMEWYDNVNQLLAEGIFPISFRTMEPDLAATQLVGEVVSHNIIAPTSTPNYDIDLTAKDNLIDLTNI